MSVLTNCKHKLAICAMAATLLPWNSIQAANDIDFIAAVVNNDVIMHSELNAELTSVSRQLQRQQTVIANGDVLREKVLEQLILELLQLQEAERLGVEVSETMLNNAMANIAKNNNLSMAQLQQAIINDGQSVAGFRDQIQRTMTIEEVGKIAVQRRIKVSEKEVEQYLTSQQGLELADTEYLLAHILISVPAQATAQQNQAAEEKLAQLQAAIAKGDDFASLAVTYSSANNALDGGNLGWRRVSQLPTLFADAVANMQIGDTSQPLRNSSGYHIIKAMDQRGLALQQADQTKANHILILSNEIRDAAASAALIKEIYGRLQSGVEFYKLARSFSDDANTALKGGDMGWLNPGQLPDYMQTQLDALATGAISQPFQGPNGWHILQAVERQTKNVGQNILRNKARNALYDNKFAGEMETWLRELRNQAYIEIR
ncbi:MAG: peptidylprolyl isomerase [Gammaproteobacteria bacterium]|nr:peptidylprolyl isomerase [Gammaproteobacteria bacterium]